MKVYDVTYSIGIYDYEHTHVYAENKREARMIVKREIGSNVKIIEIEEEE